MNEWSNNLDKIPKNGKWFLAKSNSTNCNVYVALYFDILIGGFVSAGNVGWKLNEIGQWMHLPEPTVKKHSCKLGDEIKSINPTACPKDMPTSFIERFRFKSE